jgi:hypothetical protein
VSDLAGFAFVEVEVFAAADDDDEDDDEEEEEEEVVGLVVLVGAGGVCFWAEEACGVVAVLVLFFSVFLPSASCSSSMDRVFTIGFAGLSSSELRR